MNRYAEADNQFVERLRSARQTAGITQDELSRMVSAIPGVSISPTALAKIETGSRAVRFGEAAAIATVLNFPLPGSRGDDESPAGARQRHLDLAALHLRSKVNSANAAVNAAKHRLQAAKSQLDVITALSKAVSGKTAQADAYDLQDFGRQVLTAVEEAGIPAQEFLDALELSPVDMFDHGPEPVDADMDPGYIAIAIADKYPIKVHEAWKDIEDASDG